MEKLKGSENEELCKTILDSYFREELQVGDMTWEKLRQDEEPPDYWLTINDFKYAVEMTDVDDDTEVSDEEHPYSTHISHLQRLAKEIEDIAKEKGILEGAYKIFRTGKSWLSDKKDAKEFIENALSYIEKTKDLITSTKEIILQKNRGHVNICKVECSNDKVKLFEVRSAWLESIEKPLRFLEKAIFGKKKRLSNNDIRLHKTILVIRSRYEIYEIKTLQECINEIEEHKLYHSIFFVYSKKSGKFFWSRESSWIENEKT